MQDGYLNKCKECAKKDTRKNWKDKQDYYREYDRLRATLPHREALYREYQKTKKGKSVHKKSHEKWKENNPEKYAAHILVNNKVRSGEILKKPCKKCGSRKSQAHHKDYSKPLLVTWLCSKCHSFVHRLERLKK